MTATLHPPSIRTRPVLHIGPRLMVRDATAQQEARLREALDFSYTSREMVYGEMKSVVRTYPVVDASRGHLLIPTGCLQAVRDVLGECELSDWTVSPRPAQPFALALQRDDRDGQRAALDGYWRANGSGGRGGCIIAPCGAGKSWIGIRLIMGLQVKTLVIVHTKELLEQWRDGLQRAFPGATVGIIAAGKVQIGDITVALIQTLRTCARSVAKEFGLVIVDEVHHSAAETYFDVLNTLYARVKVGVTASAHRDDGLSPLIESLCGPIVATISQQQMTDDGVVLAPIVRVVRTGWTWACSTDARNTFYQMAEWLPRGEQRDIILLALDDGREPTCQRIGNQLAILKRDHPGSTEHIERHLHYKCHDAVADFTRMLSALVEDAGRNDVIIAESLRAVADGRHVLALSARTEHLRHLCWRANEELPGIAQLITGKEPAKARRAAMLAMQRGEVPVTFATTALAKEGLDAPVLDTLLWCTPVKNCVTVQQATGRIQRAMDGKPTPRVIDLRDDRCERRSDLDDACSSERVLYYQFKARERVYRDLRAEWE